MPEALAARDLAGLPGMPSCARLVRLRATRESWPYREEHGNGGLRRLYIVDSLPQETRAHLSAAALPSSTELAFRTLASSLAERYAKAPPEHRERSHARVRSVELYLHWRKLGATSRVAAEHVRTEFGTARSKVLLWLSMVQDAPREDWAALLLPAWVSKSQLDSIHPDAWNWLCSDVLRLSRPAFSACYRRLRTEAKKHAEWGTIPSERSVRRRYDREVSPTAKLVRREGIKAFEHKIPAQRRDTSNVLAYQWLNGDGHKFDVFVAWPTTTGRPRIVRPILHALQCVRSRKLVSWRLDVTENTDATRLAMADAIGRYGVFEHITVDNGHAWAGKQMTGGCETRKRFGGAEPGEADGLYKVLGITPHFTQVAHGQSKPIERSFRDFCVEEIAKSPECAGAYTGNSPSAKPADYGDRAVPIQDFLALIERKVAEYNAREVEPGRSRDQVFEQGLAAWNPVRLSERQTQWLLMAFSDDVRISRDEAVIHFQGNRYQHEFFYSRQGQTVHVRFDPNPLGLHSGLWVFEPGSLDALCFAECIEKSGYGDMEAARVAARVVSARRKAAKAEAAEVGTLSARELSGEPAPHKRSEKKTGDVIRVNFGIKPEHRPSVALGGVLAADNPDGADALTQKLFWGTA